MELNADGTSSKWSNFSQHSNRFAFCGEGPVARSGMSDHWLGLKSFLHDGNIRMSGTTVADHLIS